MRVGIDVRIDAQGDGGQLAHFAGDAVDAQQFCAGFDIEAVNVEFEGPADLVLALADTGEDHFGSIAAGRDDAFEFADRDNVKTRSETREDVQNSEVGVCLDGIADEMRMAFEGVVECMPVSFERCS